MNVAFLPWVSGGATATTGMACASVHSLSLASASRRVVSPMTTTKPARVASVTPAIHNARRETDEADEGGVGSGEAASDDMGFSDGRGFCLAAALMKD